MVLSKDFKEFVELLNSNQVKYLIVGGYALAFHGHPRYTKDIDIWILTDPKNAKKMLMVLNDFGLSQLGLKEEDFLTPDTLIQLGYPPNRIDILTGATGIDFDECYAQKISFEIGGLTVDLIDIENLKKNKQATGRLQDLADLEHLK
jgi:hypothetical protein